MRAIIHERYGPPSALVYGELPTPVPGADAVLVRVRAAAIFFGDHRVICGRPFVVRFVLAYLEAGHTQGKVVITV